MPKISMELTDVLGLIERAMLQKQYDEALQVLRDLRKQIDEYGRPIKGGSNG